MAGLAIGLGIGLSFGQRGGYVLPTPQLLESFDSLTGITTNNGFSALDSVNKVQGTNAVKMIGNGVAFANPRLDKSLAVADPTQMGTIVFHAHVKADYSENNITLQFGDASTLSTSAPSWSFGTSMADKDEWFARHASEYTEFGGTIPGALTRWRLTQSPNNPYASEVSVDCMMRNADGRPTIVLTADDAIDTQYTVGFPYMRDRGVPFHINAPSASVGTANHLTYAQLIEMHNSGLVDIGPNNTTDDQAANVKFTTVADAVNDTLACRSAIIAGMGFTPRGINCGCYSNGVFQATTTKSDVAAMTQTNGSADVSFGAAPTRAVAVGDTLQTYGDMDGATVLSVTDTTHVTMSRAATTTQTKMAQFNDRSGAFYFPKYPNALAADGTMKMMRSTLGEQWYTRYGFGSRRLWHPGQSTSGSSGNLATIGPLIDLAIKRGTTLIIYFHGFTSGALAWAEATQCIDYIVTKRNAGLLDVLTPEQLYNRDVNGLSLLPV